MKKITIKNNSGGRLDKFLKEEVFLNKKISRGEVVRNIKAGHVLVNDKIVKPSYILKEDDKIIAQLAPCNLQLVPNKNIKLEIIYQDEDIIVMNKPAGLQMHPGFKNEDDTLANGLIYKFPEIKNVGEDPMRPGIVHRLDKDTSGIVIVAKNQKTFEELKNKFKNREITKKYLALAWGHINPKKGIIEKPIAKASNYKKQVIAGRKTKTKIRPAITEYKVLKSYPNYDLVEVFPKTGRMHQIRVHLASIGHPILGDEKYKLKNTPELKMAGRQMLHAESIKFKLFGKKYNFKSELPEDFQKILKELTKLR